MKYDLIKDNTIIRTKKFNDTPPILAAHKGKWLQRVQLDKPVYDSGIQSLEPNHTVAATESQHGYSIVDLTQAEIDINLQSAKDTKCTEIDNKTSNDITAIAGDAVKQRNSMMEYLLAKDAGLDTSAFESLAVQIKTLRETGNAKEAQVQECTTINEVEAI